MNKRKFLIFFQQDKWSAHDKTTFKIFQVHVVTEEEFFGPIAQLVRAPDS